MTPIKLPVFHHTDNSTTLKDCGIEYTLENNCEVREIIFYQINAISEYIEGDNNYTSIHSNGTEYICTMSLNEVLKSIS